MPKDSINTHNTNSSMHQGRQSKSDPPGQRFMSKTEDKSQVNACLQANEALRFCQFQL